MSTNSRIRIYIFIHLKTNLECQNACDENAFKIIDNVKTKNELRIKEALHIKWINPNLNKQKVHRKITLVM